MARPAFSPGWRFSALDGVVLVVGMAASIVAGAFVWWLGFLISFTIAHFFLFCNLVRLSRPLELVWAAIFVTLCAATMLLDRPGWPLTAAISFGVTAVVVVTELRKPSYHGLGWQRINPELPAWWNKQFSAKDATGQTGSG